ncbi:MAG: hypothetical protein JWM34_2108 [Ilumatobacteraceae bacterium]|nr:hypothetical protein [Ilumatobacteraceae bacterium]
MIEALDGVMLRADLARVDDPIGAVVLTHPHPLYGGNRFNPIVATLFRGLPDAGIAAVRFDFRGVDESGGEHDHGDSERLDVVAAIELLELAHPAVPVWLVGYSFGSVVALNVIDPRVHGWVAIAPPLAAQLTPGGRCLADHDPRPKLLLVPERDQFSPPDASAAVAASWADTELRVIAGVDHFLGAAVPAVAEDVISSLVGRLRPPRR